MADTEFDRRLDSFDTRLRLQEKVVTELFESVRILNKSVQSLEQSNEKRIAIDDALKTYIEGLREEQKEQRNDRRADQNAGFTKRNFALAVFLAVFVVGQFVLGIMNLKP